MPRVLWAGAGAAVVVFLLPLFLIPRSLPPGAKFDPEPIVGTDLATFEESMSFGAVLHEVAEGRWPVRDPSLWEHKGGPVFGEPLMQLVSGGVARTVGVNGTFVLADLVLPGATFLLAGWLVHRWTRSKALALLGASGVVFGYAVIQRFPPLTAAGWEQSAALFTDGGYRLPFDITRFPFPELTLPAFLYGLVLIWKALERPTRARILSAGIGSGLQFPLYPYNGVLMLVFLVALLVVSALRRDPDRARDTVRMLLIALIVLLPSAAALSTLWALPDLPGTLARLGLERGHVPELARTVEVVLLGVAVLGVAGLRTLTGRFLASLALAGVIAMNLQLVTGVSVQRWHYFARLLNPVAALTVATLTGIALGRWPKLRAPGLRVLGYAAVLAIFAGAAGHQVRLSRTTARAFALPAEDRVLVTYLNRLPPDAVVGSLSFATIALVPSRTSLNVFVPFGNQTLAPNAELTERYLRLAKLAGLTPQFIRDVFAENPDRAEAEQAACTGERCALDWSLKDRNATEQLLHFTYLRIRSGLFSYTNEIRMPDAEVDRLVQRFEALPSDPRTLLRPYRLDYVVIGPREAALGMQGLPETVVARTVDIPGWKIQEIRP
jgi:hypothetical protein